MSKDSDKITKLLSVASNESSLQDIQGQAGQKLMDHCGEEYPHNGCAITLSCLLQNTGIDVDDTFMAFEMDQLLKDRGWTVVDVGNQKPGDVGTTCGDEPQHGVDHVYLVLSVVDDDQMMIADNQKDRPHTRFASGKGKSPTTYFLRA